MILNDIPYGAIFVLNRSGQTYRKGKRICYKGKVLKRFRVYQICGEIISLHKKYGQTLSLQCEVTLLS